MIKAAPNDPLPHSLFTFEHLGVAYALGHGVEQSYSEAAKWYRRAVDQGLANAQFLLAVAYANGHGVPQDDAEVLK